MNLTGDPKKILIINLGGIGDLLLSMPALKAIRNRFPQAAITMLAAKRVAGFVSGLAYIDETAALTVNSRDGFPIAGLFGNIFTLLRLKKEHFDLAVNMRTLVSRASAAKIKFLIDMIGPVSSAGRDTDGMGYFFDIKIPESVAGEKFEAEYDVDLARAIGVDAVDRSVELMLSKGAVDKVLGLLSSQGVREGDIIIGVHPGGALLSRWPAENFSNVVKEIGKRLPCKFVVTGDRSEAGLAKMIKRGSPATVLDFTGKTDLQELAALIKNCRLYISNDTGPMHIAAALRTPLVALFPSSRLRRFDPRSISDKAIVLCGELDSPARKTAQSDGAESLKRISVEEAVESALSLLKTQDQYG